MVFLPFLPFHLIHYLIKQSEVTFILYIVLRCSDTRPTQSVSKHAEVTPCFLRTQFITRVVAGMSEWKSKKEILNLTFLISSKKIYKFICPFIHLLTFSIIFFFNYNLKNRSEVK